MLACSVFVAGCESSQTKSARIAKQASEVIRKQAEPFSIGRASRTVKVKRAVVLSDAQGSAVALELKVGGGKSQANVPIVFTVTGKDGAKQFSNDLKGLQPSLQTLALATPRQTTWWVNDQLLGVKNATAATAQVGDGRRVAGRSEVDVINTDFHPDPDGTYYEGTLVNKTGRDLLEVPVYGVGLKGDRVIAAGRSIVPKLPAKAGQKPTRFRIFFTGDPTGTRVQVTVAPTIVPVSEATTP